MTAGTYTCPSADTKPPLFTQVSGLNECLSTGTYTSSSPNDQLCAGICAGDRQPSPGGALATKPHMYSAATLVTAVCLMDRVLVCPVAPTLWRLLVRSMSRLLSQPPLTQQHFPGDSGAGYGDGRCWVVAALLVCYAAETLHAAASAAILLTHQGRVSAVGVLRGR